MYSNSKHKTSDSRSNKFASYLTGLIEGDGDIFAPAYLQRDKKNKQLYPSIQLCFNTKDLPLVFKIQKIIGHGSINKKKGVNAYVYTLANKEGLQQVSNLINGLFRTPKIDAFHKLINHLNLKHNTDISLLPKDSSNLSDNSWLSGFIDADGHFGIRISEAHRCGNARLRIACQFEIVQRQIDISGGDLFGVKNKLTLFLETNLKKVKIESKNPQYRVRTCSLKSNKILINYLNNYPQFSSKYLDYSNWLKAVNIFERKEHLDTSGAATIRNLRSLNNDARDTFNWDHLIKLYNLYE